MVLKAIPLLNDTRRHVFPVSLYSTDTVSVCSKLYKLSYWTHRTGSGSWTAGSSFICRVGRGAYEWSQWANAFDGISYWSYISGPRVSQGPQQLPRVEVPTVKSICHKPVSTSCRLMTSRSRSTGRWNWDRAPLRNSPLDWDS